MNTNILQKATKNPLYLFLLKRIKHSITIKIFLKKILWNFSYFQSNGPTYTILKRLVQEKGSNVFFINIGANDGLSGDFLFEFIYKNKWPGILVEPVEFVFERLKQVYQDIPGIIFENSAISDRNDKQNFYYLKRNNVLPAGYDQIGSFNRDHLLNHSNMFPGLEEYIVEKEVNCVSIEGLLDKYCQKVVDIIHIDAEGYDYQILKKIPFSKIKPSVIVFESIHLTTDEITNSKTLLTKNGYKIVQDGPNLLAHCYQMEL
ncbi:FkbM family methyltransferase [Patescibacteria group bacterium]|nr:FkbM family methyltransferase [Patescibacteria group bacterium]